MIQIESVNNDAHDNQSPEKAFIGDNSTDVKTENQNNVKNKTKKKITFWTKEKIEIAKRLCENGFKPKDIAMATGMSIGSASRFYSETYPEDVGGKWKEYTIAKKGRTKKDRTELHNKLIEIVNSDRTLSLRQICERLPKHLRISVTCVSRELKNIKGLKRNPIFGPNQKNRRKL